MPFALVISCVEVIAQSRMAIFTIPEWSHLRLTLGRDSCSFVHVSGSGLLPIF